MANNYFGFTPGGTQYSAQPTAAYPTAQTAYVAAQPAQTAYAAAAAPRAAPTYETFQPAPSSGTYAYAARTQPAYEQKTYYQPAAQPAYTVAAAPTDTAYQTAAKPAYVAGTFQTPPTRQTATQKTGTAGSVPSSTGYAYSTSSSTTQPRTFAQTTTSTTYSASSYYQQQQQVAKPGNTWKYTKGVQGQKIIKKPTPKQMQLHYCDVCKISCAGPQTYREHLEGQKHKKKEAAAKEGSSTNSGRGQNQLRCELCDVACTGTDAYQAHIRGAKHQKVLKLHTMLGKPIPSTDPVVVNTASASSASTSSSRPTTVTKTVTKTIATATATAKKVVTPKITFVGGSQLKSTSAGKIEEVKTEPKTEPASVPEEKMDKPEKLLPGEKDVQPVGHEYIEEVKNELGKTISFNCKLCECKFNDPNAKEMHKKEKSTDCDSA